jgi:hypothetical protein
MMHSARGLSPILRLIKPCDDIESLQPIECRQGALAKSISSADFDCFFIQNRSSDQMNLEKPNRTSQKKSSKPKLHDQMSESVLPHRNMSRRHMDTESWLSPLTGRDELGRSSKMPAPTKLDLFDPFDQLDTLMSRDIDWIKKPALEPLHPRVQQKVILI